MFGSKLKGMELHLKGTNKEVALQQVEQQLKGLGFQIIDKDFNRPWGGFLVIDEDQAPEFIRHFFPDLQADDLKISGKLSPKFLVVAPGKRLSWQYHYRRAEIWRVVSDSVAVAISETDEQTEPVVYPKGKTIRLNKGQRHRLTGLEDWGVVAEIWQHTEVDNPSDESDIVRLQDDFDRKSG